MCVVFCVAFLWRKMLFICMHLLYFHMFFYFCLCGVFLFDMYFSQFISQVVLSIYSNIVASSVAFSALVE